MTTVTNRTPPGGDGRAAAASVVFVLPFPPTADFAPKFFVRELAAAGMRTEYWNVAAVMGYAAQPGVSVDGLGYREIGSFDELARAVADVDAASVAYVVQVTRAVGSLRLYRAFSDVSGKLIFFGRGYLPSPPAERSPAALVRKLVSGRSARSIAEALLARLLRGRLPRTRVYDLVFAAGAAARRRHAGDARAVVDIHHFDVDAALAPTRIALPPAVGVGRAVFLDDYLPFHPDFAALGVRTVTPEPYYAALNDLFGRVEAALGVPVVVAAHPRARYAENPFGGREIVHGATSALVADADLVLAHASTAVSLAVIHQRPLCLVSTREIVVRHPYLYRMMEMTAQSLACPLLDCADPLPADARLHAVDRARYDRYYHEFLSLADPGALSSDIVVRELAALLVGREMSVPPTHAARAGVREEVTFGG